MAEKIQIKPSEYYTLFDLVRMNAFPFCGTDVRTYRKIVQTDSKSKNCLRPILSGEGRGQRYQFKGENIISFVRGVESGKIRV